jgi:methylthioribose-1-phosphate isomerase
VFERLCRTFPATPPPADTLFWANARQRRDFEANRPRALDARGTLLEREAQGIHHEDSEIHRRMGQHGQALLERGAVVLTHCNAGALATAGYGTALGVVRAAREAGKRVQVIACETRPYLQGARLTAWELKQDRIPVTLITDSMAAHFMQRGRVNCVIVGADRVAANGDVANKIGTYAHAVVAKRHGIPFYVAAPLSTIDFDCPDGAAIPIEERTSREVTHVFDRQIAPTGVKAEHPAFDVTPSELVSGIITERGIARRPYLRTLARLRRTPLVSVPAGARTPARSAGKTSVRRQRRS